MVSDNTFKHYHFSEDQLKSCNFKFMMVLLVAGGRCDKRLLFGGEINLRALQ